MAVRHPRLRAFRLWFILTFVGGYYDNHRKCGCCDYHPPQRGLTTLGLHPTSVFGPTFYLVWCDTCKVALKKFFEQSGSPVA